MHRDNIKLRVRHVGIKHKQLIVLMSKQSRKTFLKMVRQVREQRSASSAANSITVQNKSSKLCPECNREFKDVEDVLSHSSQEHYGEQLLAKYKPLLGKSKKCPICELNLKAFTDAQLQHHMGVNHNRMKLLISDPRLRDAYYNLE
jgi:hypothetical protein